MLLGLILPGSTSHRRTLGSRTDQLLRVSDDQVSLDTLDRHRVEPRGSSHDVVSTAQTAGALVSSLRLRSHQVRGVLQVTEADVFRISRVHIDVQNHLTLAGVLNRISSVSVIQVGSNHTDIRTHIGSEAIGVVHTDTTDGGTSLRLPLHELSNQLSHTGVTNDDEGQIILLDIISDLMNDILQTELNHRADILE
ncbi:MAG: hypothetical protein NC548_39810, partial [Lachnospiraceae bacterium]|nr:hypothetical protein [Lachnospiraceae bacterium]